MRILRRLCFLPLPILCILFVALGQGPPMSPTLPHLKRQGSATQLIVDGKPLLLLAGETGNSSASDPRYLESIWPKVVQMRLNALLVPVYWELIEPTEGAFDFSLVDSAIASARRHGLRLVPLWFGTWKNSMSCYAPLWVKKDQSRFPRARTSDGMPLEILTPFSDTNRDADIRAFAALMRHIREVDESRQTVVMVQVENEIGMIPEARDHSDEAESAFSRAVPGELMQYLQEHKESLSQGLREAWASHRFRTTGTWEEVFGKGLHTDELFMAWHFGRYTDAVTAAGKKEYALPMYVNAALIRPGRKPGQYPSAGPLPHLFDVWKPAAPAVDFLSPDIYFPSFVEWSTPYDRPGNPLFIPEVGNSQSMTQAFYAFGRLNAMGYSPFSIESLENPEDNQVSRAYDVLAQLSPLIAAHQGKGTMTAVLLDSADQKAEVKLGDYIFTVRHEYSWPYASKSEGKTPRFGCMIIMVSPDEYFVAGQGVVVTFGSGAGERSVAGIGSLDEGRFVDGTWKPGRRMNGDQSHQGRHLHLPGHTFSIQKARLYTYK